MDSMNLRPRFRRLVFTLFLGFSLTVPVQAQTGPLFHGCPVEGDATETSRSDPALNVLKNRTAAPADGFQTMHFEDLAQLEVPDGVSKKHRSTWPDATVAAVTTEEKKAVKVIGFLLKKKLEGPRES